MDVMTLNPNANAVGETIRFAVGRCWLGSILVAESDEGVCAILLGEDPDLLVADLANRFGTAQLTGADEAAERRLAEAVLFVDAPSRGFEAPLDARGTPFEQRVWQAIRQIPAGATATYGQIAEQVGQPRMARDVAEACAANPLAVAIPCHRVLRVGGGLSGYRWGVKRKRALLQREGAWPLPDRGPQGTRA